MCEFGVLFSRVNGRCVSERLVAAVDDRLRSRVRLSSLDDDEGFGQRDDPHIAAHEIVRTRRSQLQRPCRGFQTSHPLQLRS
jgi:hypothetical protein